MALTFEALKTELGDRGFSDLSDSRRGYYINAARAELDRMHLWPWREASGTGTAPLTVSDLGVIEAVTNETQDYALTRREYRDLVNQYGDISTSGTPSFYYVGWPSGAPVVATYPTSSDTIGVQYWKVTADLADPSDEPDSPDDAHYLIVDLAVRRAYRDVDNHEGADAVQEEIDRQLNDLLVQYPPGFMDDQGLSVLPSSDW